MASLQVTLYYRGVRVQSLSALSPLEQDDLIAAILFELNPPGHDPQSWWDVEEEMDTEGNVFLVATHYQKVRGIEQKVPLSERSIIWFTRRQTVFKDHYTFEFARVENGNRLIHS